MAYKITPHAQSSNANVNSGSSGGEYNAVPPITYRVRQNNSYEVSRMSADVVGETSHLDAFPWDDELREAKVNELEAPVSVPNEYVLRLQVAMNDLVNG
jgi:hypothetical protein